MATILCVDDEADVGLILHDTLERLGHTPVIATSVPQALQALAAGNIALVISDVRMPGLGGLELLQLLQQEGHDVPIIMLTGYASIENAVESMRAGAVDYITKPIRADQLGHAVHKALDFARLRHENDALRREVMELRTEREIIGESAPMRRLLQTVAMAAPTRATVLLQGESGTGKELVARALHDRSDRSHGPFVKLNCAALPEGLVESALFGHEKGAFTGALKRVEGAFERASGGTLLLDEISEMRLDLQAKLLRVLQEQEFERVGGTHPIKVDVRVIATTNRRLADEVAARRFRQDLYFRLSVLPIELPPLRERREDIPLLSWRFAMQAATELRKEITSIAVEVAPLLQRHSWPGNVRELQHVMERAVILSSGPVLQLAHFPALREYGDGQLIAGSIGTPRPIPDGVVLTSLDLVEAERVLISHALRRTNGNRTHAAELLGISIRTLRNKLNVSPDSQSA